MGNIFKYELGSRAKDKITGLQGILVARNQHLHNCNTYGIKPEKLHDGKPMDCQWFDEPQIEIIKEGIFQLKQETGGPTDNPKL